MTPVQWPLWHPTAGDHSIRFCLVALQVFARQQAQRDEEIAKCRRNIQLLEEEVAELEHENRLRSQQVSTSIRTAHGPAQRRHLWPCSKPTVVGSRMSDTAGGKGGDCLETLLVVSSNGSYVQQWSSELAGGPLGWPQSGSLIETLESVLCAPFRHAVTRGLAEWGAVSHASTVAGAGGGAEGGAAAAGPQREARERGHDVPQERRAQAAGNRCAPCCPPLSLGGQAEAREGSCHEHRTVRLGLPAWPACARRPS